jgi:RNA polymerase sigma-70 factor (ECF subfamily)
LGRDDKTLSLFMTHQAELVAYAVTIVGCRARAEDVVQEAYLRFEDATGNRELAQPVGYLYRIVRNLAVDGSRRLALESRHIDGDAAVAEAPANQPSPEDAAVHRDELKIVAAALAELPARTRRALEMHRLEGLKLKDIAERLGISITLAHGLIHEALAHCRRRLRGDRS